MRRLALVLVMAAMSLPGARAQETPFAVAGIAAEPSAGGVTLAGRALALVAGRYEAEMRIEKSGASGRTSTTQGGAVTLAAGETGTVATVGLSMAPGDTLAVELVLSAKGREISRSRLSVGN